jgi:vitamin B12 transporter
MNIMRLIYIIAFLVNIIFVDLHGNDPDTLRLQEIEISGLQSPDIYSGLSRVIHTYNRETISRMPVNTIQDILEYVTSLDIRQRGSHGVQADISMRGGSFEQVLVLLNGVRINDPQSGHHTMNIPVNTWDIERIEILEGPGSRIYGPNAFSGAVNIITRQPGGESAFLAVNGGQYRFLDLYGSAGFESGPVNNLLSVGRKTSDGFADNTDFSITNVFYRGLSETGIGTFDLQAGYLDKSFGASNFYSSLYPEQYEQIRATYTNLTFRSGQRIKYNQSVYWKRHHDRFELFRYEAAPWYQGHNYHMTDLYGTNLGINIPYSLGNLYFGTEFRTEQIHSTVLGEELETPRPVKFEDDVFFSHFKSRDQINITAGNSIIVNRFAISAGALLTNTGYTGWGAYGGVDMSLAINDAVSWFVSWNQSLRIPSFTEMYYRGPVNRGNPLLEPEKSATVESGFRYRSANWRGHVVGFSRKGRNIIDWVKLDDELIWESMNITRLDTYGIEIDLSWKKPEDLSFPVREFRAGYAFLDISRQSKNYISAYVLDHLKHKIVTQLIVPLYRSADMIIMTSWQDRAGTYTGFPSGEEIAYAPFTIVDAGTSFTLNEVLNFSLQLSNLFNTDYTDIGNVPVPGRWIRAGINLRFPYNSR